MRELIRSQTEKTRIRAVVLTIQFVLLFSTMGALAVPSSNGLKQLPNHRPELPPGLVSHGRLASTNRLRLAIGLPLSDPQGLDDFLSQIYDPTSPNFHHYLTAQKFTQRFGPTPSAYEAVIEFARTNGFAITAMHGNRLLLDVEANPADIERAFHINLLAYAHPTEQRDFFAPDSEPAVDATLPIADISGLNNYVLPRPHFRKLDPAAAATAPQTGSSPSGAYMGSDFRNAYVPGTPLTGTGQMVGLLQFDGFYANDITAYEAAAGLPNVPIQTVLLDGFNGQPTTAGNMEVSLDIEMVISMAPRVSKVVVFEAGPSGDPNDILNSMAANTQIKQFSSSWGWSGGPSTTTDNIFKQMAAQGQSFFNASGDSDAFTTGSRSANGVDNTSLPNAPVSSPYITAVGGTTLTTSGRSGPWASETVWNWGLRNSDYVGSSGGISSYYALPAWQAAISMAGNGGSTSRRNIPDVALAADNIYVISGNGSKGAVGGTSCAAPLWAAFAALVNQQAASVGNASIGFINPTIYALGNGPSYTSLFHDISSGNNFSANSPGLFNAVAGYDLCTGWGTPAGIPLINALAGVSSLTPQFQTMTTAGNNFSLNFSTTPGLTYQVQYTTSLLQPNWLNLGSSFIATGTSSTIVDSSALINSAQRFYRIKLSQ